MLKKTTRTTAFLIFISVVFMATYAVAAPSRVFVTSDSFSGGQFGGLSGADDVCNRLAASASLTGTYTAWISDSSTDAADRVYHNPDGYITTNGNMVANSWADLINAISVPLLTTINYDQNGADVGTVQPWTGTYEDGQASDDNCNDWTSPFSESDYGDTGLTNDTGEYWSEYTAEHCDHTNPLYCFENQPFTPPPTLPNAPRAAVPTVNEWGMIIMAVLLAALSSYFIWRKKRLN